jgi:hypothetical protein
MTNEQVALFEAKLLARQREHLDVNLLKETVTEWMRAKHDLLDVKCHCGKDAQDRKSVAVTAANGLEDVPFCDDCGSKIEAARTVMDQLRAARVAPEGIAQA